MSCDNQKTDINPIGEFKVQSMLSSSILKRPFEIKNIPSQPPVKFAKVKYLTLSSQPPALLQNEKVMPTQPIVDCPKVYVAPSADGIDNETEEIDVVAVEPERRLANPFKVLPVKSQIQNALKISTMQGEMPGTYAATNSKDLPSTLAVANRNNACSFFNFEELRRRTSSAFARRSLHGPTDKSLQLLTIAAFDFLKDIIEQITAVARSRIEGAANKYQQELVKEERQKIEFLNDVQGFLEAFEPEAEENSNNPDGKSSEKKRVHREIQIHNTNETALAAIGGRFCPTMTEVNVTNNKPKLLTQVQMQDCLFYMENNAMFCKSELLYEYNLKYT